MISNDLPLPGAMQAAASRLAGDDDGSADEPAPVATGDAEAWFRSAVAAEHRGEIDAAMGFCQQAIAIWPDIHPVYALQLRLALRGGDPDRIEQALRALHGIGPDEPSINGELGARLCIRGRFNEALPFLRKAVPVLQHENDTLWNYTLALAVEGRYNELVANAPMLDRLAVGVEGPYAPYVHLAVARLSLRFDRTAVIAAAAALEASDAWLDAGRVLDRLGAAIVAREPFSLVRLDYALARFCCYLSFDAHRVLQHRELSAVINSVWQDWFGAPVETLGVLFMAGIERSFRSAIESADVIGCPHAENYRSEHYHFGFLAEMRRALPACSAGSFTSFHIADILHELVPFLRPVLSGLPFLGIVGPYPELAAKLGRFCGIDEVRSFATPPVADRAGFLPEGHCRLLEELAVPFRGAVFLVAAPGPLSVIFCGHVKALGGIAVDIGALVDRWARR